MDSVIQEFIKWTIIGLGAGVFTLAVVIFVQKTKPKHLKIGNVLEADWADQASGTVTLNVDGQKKIYFPGEQGELIINAIENFFGDYIDEKAAYIRKAMQYAETRLKGFSGDIQDAVIAHFPQDLDPKAVEDRIKFLGLIGTGLVHALADFLKESFKNNGFYEMRFEQNGVWYANAEWKTFILRQVDALHRTTRHYLGNHLPHTWGLRGRDVLNFLWEKEGQPGVCDPDKEEDYMYSLTEEIYLAAWENQRTAKLKKAQYQNQRKTLLTSLRSGSLAHL